MDEDLQFSLDDLSIYFQDVDRDIMYEDDLSYTVSYSDDTKISEDITDDLDSFPGSIDFNFILKMKFM